MTTMKKERYNSTMSTNIFLFVVGLSLFILFFIKVFLSASGVIPDGRIFGFAVDSNENVYIGTMKRINVYKDGNLLRKIDPPTSRSYQFYIENDQLIIGCAVDNKGGTFDLEGKELSYGEYSYDEIEHVAKRKIVTVNEHLYQLNGSLGITPYTITRDGVEVYRMSTMDYLFNGLPYWIVWICLSLAAVFLILLKVSELQN